MADNNKKPFLLFRAPGSGWVQGKTSREQPFWDEHAVFMDKLFDEGRIILAGPYADYSGVLLIVAAANEAGVHEMFAADPFTTEQILETREVKEWLIFLDSRQKQ